ncbi:hypothetical protein KDA00_05590 [Candidatus Saccharibacteria bacterium]|nr:hypothetical protein [Candidatus Saccharibacteria bacterium]
MPEIEQYDWSKLKPNTPSTKTYICKPKIKKPKAVKKYRRPKAKDKTVFAYNDKAIGAILRRIV